ncbi:RHS repeat-associated core domain-containing protein [Pseudoxanthomonas indica]|uniref:RHS repeat-associated core domain-containing protein n=1 Tax=Pseudoxanthomonas indica TaxID=428993 RepID=A0A1T5LK44_9GAMM|nr:RHS repeat-associated core domain-containing protein [Pseudoxanthomonas indica]GGD36198.1 type IV secretion protein Rhs [Pseudoxanthomonas indica]SKC76326.1 RHS repeat-associated core domain-containing protein [Pseudoxanthomonas indica]
MGSRTLAALAGMALFLISFSSWAGDEVCLENGGTKSCARPSEDWTAAVCVEQMSHFAIDSAMCRLLGGVYQGGNSNPACIGGEPFITKETAAELADEYFAERYSCPYTSKSDTGWGASLPASYFCYAGPSTYRYGQLKEEFRKFTFSGKARNFDGTCSLDTTVSLITTNVRDVMCAPGAVSLYGANNTWLDCFNEHDKTCPINNPVMPGDGMHVKSEVDFQAPGSPLRFVRTFAPANGSVPRVSTASSPMTVGKYWYFNYGMRVDKVVNSDYVAAIATRDDGSRVYFDPSGNPLQRSDGEFIRYEELPDGSMVITQGADTERYTSDGKLGRIDYASGQYVQLTYDDPNRRIDAQDQNGRTLSIHYWRARVPSHIVMPDGGTITYGYDSVKRTLNKVKFADGASRTFNTTFTGNGRFDVYDELGVLYSTHLYTHQTLGARISSSNLASGLSGGQVGRQIYTYTQGSNGASSLAVTGPLGQAVTRNYQTKGNTKKLVSQTQLCATCGGSTASKTYDANGYVDVETDFKGSTTDYTIDSAGRELSRIEAANDTTGQKRTIETDWHATLKLPLERRTRDATGLLKARTVWTYNARGQVLTLSAVDTLTGAQRTQSYAYCEASDVLANTCPLVGLLLSADGPLAGTVDRSTYHYYAADDASCATTPTTCPHRKGDLWKVTNALGQTMETLRYDGAGRTLSVKDPNGVVTDQEYHARGWRTATKVRGADDNVETDDVISRVEYWPTGLVKRVTQPDGSYTQFTYDQAHRLTDVTDAAGNYIHYVQDFAGNRISEQTKDSGGNLKRSLSRVFNQRSQLLTQADAQANPTDFTYDANGNTKTITDALDRVTDQSYDPLNRLARTLQDMGGIAAETRFAYDALDNLVKVTDPKGLDTTYSYNSLGDLTQLSSPDTGVTTYTYDAAGNRSTQTDARNVTSVYAYDGLGRITGVSYPTTSLNVGYVHDLTQGVCATGETYSVGRLTRMNDASGNTQYCYNRFGYLARKVQTTNGIAFTVRYLWNAAGQMLGMVYPDGSEVDYSRNALGQLVGIGITRPGQAREVLLNQVTYLPFGPTSGWIYGDGRVMTRSYDQNYRPTAILDASPGGLSLGFGYDAVGNLTKLGTAMGISTPDMVYGYDALDRLTRTADGPTNVAIDSYSYDKTGNRLSHATAAGTALYAYSPTSHRLESVEGVTRTFDSAGNTLAIGSRTFVYSAANRMSEVRNEGNVVMSYAYNGRGEQVLRQSGGENFITIYDELGHWLGDYSQLGTPVQQVVWNDNFPIGLLANGGRLHYVEPDHLGTPRVVIESARDIAVWTWDIHGEVFGESSPKEDQDGDLLPLVFNLRFPGQRYDAAAGLNSNYFRNYEPGSGRYMESDSMGMAAGVNTYSYASSTPFVLVDPYGMSGTCPASPSYKPSFWNDGGHIQGTNNCYSYAADRPENPASQLPRPFPYLPQPGEWSGRPFESLTCRSIIRAAVSDGMTKPDSKGNCPSCTHKVYLVVAPEVDYHWYRQDGDGTWSHKPGLMPVSNLDASGKVITNPAAANSNYAPNGPNYSKKCGVLCALNR